jgi:hypothetical protein
MENTIFDNIEKDEIESFEIKEEPVKVNIISFDDLIMKIEYQFTPNVEVAIDNYDYMKWFFINIIKVPENEFPNVMEYINQDNEDDYENFMNSVEYFMKSKFGITFNDEEKRFENVYNLYYFLIVKPEILVVDYLLYYNFYVEGYDFKNVYEKTSLLNIPGIGNNDVDPIQIMSAARQQYTESRKREFYKMNYKDKISFFVKYAKMIFLDEHEFKFYNMFKKLNEFAPCDNYDNLDDQINIFYNIKYERDDLLSDYFTKIVLNEEYRYNYITEKIADPFYKQIKDFDYNMNKSILN